MDMRGKEGGLFDVEADIGESTDLSTERPKVLQIVEGSYMNWWKEMEAVEPRGPFRDC